MGTIGVLVAIGAIGLTVVTVTSMLVTDIRAKYYTRRGYKVTYPTLVEMVIGDGRPCVDATGSVARRKWIDSGLRFIASDQRQG